MSPKTNFGRVLVCVVAVIVSSPVFFNQGVSAAEVAPVIGLTSEQVERVYRDIDVKRRTTLPLHLPALLMKDVHEISEMKKAVAG